MVDNGNWTHKICALPQLTWSQTPGYPTAPPEIAALAAAQLCPTCIVVGDGHHLLHHPSADHLGAPVLLADATGDEAAALHASAAADDGDISTVLALDLNGSAV